jgi:tellurite resistance protein
MLSDASDAMSRVPAAMFGIVLGLAGLGSCWRLAHRVWGLPAAIGETLLALPSLVWLALIILYVGKWIAAHVEARVRCKAHKRSAMRLSETRAPVFGSPID